MKITATPTTGRELKPGDLFSTMGDDYWSNPINLRGIGQKVYIRTDWDVADDADMPVFRIEIEK